MQVLHDDLTPQWTRLVWWAVIACLLAALLAYGLSQLGKTLA